VIQTLAREYPVRRICAVCGFTVSTYYYQSHRQDLPGLSAALEQLAQQWPRYGSRRLTQLLRQEGWRVNRKRIQRLMREHGLLQKNKRKTYKTTQSAHGFGRYPNLVQDLAIARPEQVWVADITYIRLQHEWVFLAVLMDVFTRNIRGWHLTRGLDVSLTQVALERALQQYCPEIHHSDQGIHYAAPTYVQALLRHHIQVSMSAVGAAWQNGYAERLMRTIKEEEVSLSEYRDYADAYAQLGQFLDEVYTRKRIHSALGYLTPSAFEQQWRARQNGRQTFLLSNP
jgi:transposase InsO family protein